jgi:hypothetical protein
MREAKRARRAAWTVVVLVWLLVPACGSSEEQAQPSEKAAAGAAVPARKPPPFETPSVLQAADVLPEELRSGPDFSVSAEVQNDGFMNRYRLHTTWGELWVVSTPLLGKRVRETGPLDL